MTISQILATCNARVAVATATANDLASKVSTSLALFKPGSTVSPISNGDLVIEATSNTSIKIKLKGSDGTVRSTTLTLT